MILNEEIKIHQIIEGSSKFKVYTVQVQIPQVPEYYKYFSFGITLSHNTDNFNRIESAGQLHKKLSEWWPEIPISVIFNKCKHFPDPPLPEHFSGSHSKLQVTNELIPFSRCQNLHAIAYPTRPYVICFGEKDRPTCKGSIDAIINAHLSTKADVVGGYYSTALSIFKKTLADLSWWDERYYSPWNDTDMMKRMADAGIKVVHLKPEIMIQRIGVTVPTFYHLEKLEGFTNKLNGVEFHHMKWGDDCNPNIPTDRKALLPEIDWHPKYTEKFKNFKRLWEIEE